MKTYDPQVTVTAELKPNVKDPDGPELLVFSIPLVFFELTCIIPIPPDGQNTTPVYVKFRIDKNGGTRKTIAGLQGLLAPNRRRSMQSQEEDDDDDDVVHDEIPVLRSNVHTG
jgi:hypothetical protein